MTSIVFAPYWLAIVSRTPGRPMMSASPNFGSAPSRTVEVMLKHMVMSNAAASLILLEHGAKAATDVSGFGLGGHLAEMLSAGQGAIVHWHNVPLSEGLNALAEKGFASSLLSENRRQARALSGVEQLPASTLAIVFDPQTAGGLLAVVPAEKVVACLQGLVSAGYNHAADIGCITGEAGISII